MMRHRGKIYETLKLELWHTDHSLSQMCHWSDGDTSPSRAEVAQLGAVYLHSIDIWEDVFDWDLYFRQD